VAGALGGVVAFGLLAIVAAALLPRLMPKVMPRMMERMMAGGGCSDRMRECMEKCGCGEPAS
jgi:hypothetical protein